jgi:hypothetical protein
MSIQYAGGTNVNATFSASTKAALQSNILAQLVVAGWTQVTGPSTGGAQTFTITIASPGVVTLNSHGMLANDTFVPSTTGALPTGLTAGTRYFVKTVLSANTFTLSATAGGAVINTTGTQSGTHSAVCTCRIATSATPWGVTSRMNFQDNGGSCLTGSVENSNSTIVGLNSTANGVYLVPGALTWRIIANKYQAFVFLAITTPSRGFICFGTPYLPPFLQGVVTECGWCMGNSASDTDTTVRPSFRDRLQCTTAVNQNDSNVQGIVNSLLLDLATPSNPISTIALMFPSAFARGYASGQTGIHWGDASAEATEPLIMWPSTLSTGETLARGQLWDALLVCDVFAGDTTTTFDSHNWWGVTDNNTTDKGTLFIVVP